MSEIGRRPGDDQSQFHWQVRRGRSRRRRGL